MPNDIDLNLPDGVIVKLAEPISSAVKSSVKSATLVSVNTAFIEPAGAEITLTQPFPQTAVRSVESAQAVSISTLVFQGADKHGTFSFTIQSWISDADEFYIDVLHNLNKYPSVSVIDSIENVVYLSVEYIDKNSVRIYTTAKFSGKAIFN